MEFLEGHRPLTTAEEPAPEITLPGQAETRMRAVVCFGPLVHFQMETSAS